MMTPEKTDYRRGEVLDSCRVYDIYEAFPAQHAARARVHHRHVAKSKYGQQSAAPNGCENPPPRLRRWGLAPSDEQHTRDPAIQKRAHPPTTHTGETSPLLTPLAPAQVHAALSVLVETTCGPCH